MGDETTKAGIALDRKVLIALSVCACSVMFVVARYPYSVVGRQNHNLKLAIHAADKLRPHLEADARFAHVEAGKYTGLGGSLGLYGYVGTREDALVLRELVESTKPPVPVHYAVQVEPLLLEDGDDDSEMGAGDE